MDCTSGPCCDPQGHFRISTYQCSAIPYAFEYSCSSTACGGDARIREQYQYCTGASADCGTANLLWHLPVIIDNCGTDELCFHDVSSAWCVTCPGGCSGGACQPLGGDTCAAAIDLPGPGTYQGDTTTLTNDYAPTTAECTGYTGAAGPDQAWVVDLEAGELLEVTLDPDPDYDAVLYLVTDCALISATCLDGSDSALSSSVESVSWLADEATTVYVIADGYASTNHGPYTLEVDISTPTPVALGLHYMERSSWLTNYDAHEVLIGPGSSTNPLNPAWTVLGDATAMYNPASDAVWTHGLAFDIGAWSGQQVRFSFHYRAANSGNWRIDDLCVAADAPLEFQPSSCAWLETFDGVTQPALPAGWFTVTGPLNTSTYNWTTSDFYWVSSPNALASGYTTDTAVHDRYVVSPIITLP